jgi:hypothetical protein
MIGFRRPGSRQASGLVNADGEKERRLMGRLRIAGVCLVTVCVAGAAGAAGASAELPELGRCVKVTPVQEGKKTVYPGKYGSKSCIKQNALKRGKYEFLPGPGAANKFYGVASEPEPVLETTGGQKVRCSSFVLKGEYTGPKTEKATLFLGGCTDGAGRPCQANPAKEGEIEGELMEGNLAFISQSPKVVPGWDLKHEAEGTMLKYFCGKLPENIETVTGSVVGEVKGGAFSNLNKMGIESQVSFRQSEGKQLPEAFEGQPKDTLTTTTTGLEKRPAEQTGLLALVEQKSGLGEPIEKPENQEELEIKAKGN